MLKKCILLIVAKGYLITFLLFFTPISAFSFPYKGLDLKLQGAIAETYDDNITLSKDDKKDGFITALELGLSARYEGKIRDLELNSSVNQSLSSNDYSDANSTGGNLVLNFRNDLSEYDRIRLTNTYSKTVTRRSFEEEFNRVTGQLKSSSNVFNLIYNRDVTEQLTFGTRYSNNLSNYSEENTSNSNRYNGIALDAGYAYNDLTNFSFSYEFSKVGYADASKSSAHTLAMGVKRDITERLRLDGKIGVDFITDFDDKKRTEGYASISVTNEIIKDTTTNIFFTRRELTAFEGNKEQSGDSFGISVISNITGNTTVNAGFTRSALNFTDGKKTGDSFNFSVTSSVSDNLPLTLGFNKEKNTTSDRENIVEFQKTFISLPISLMKTSNIVLAGSYGQSRFTTSDSGSLWEASCAFTHDFSDDLHGGLSYSYSNSNFQQGYTRNEVSLKLSASL